MRYKIMLLTILMFGHLLAIHPILRDFRWRNDDGGESEASWRATINTSTTITNFSNIRLRFVMTSVPGGAEENPTLKLQYSRDETNWTDITTSEANHFQLALSGHFADGDAVTGQLFFLGDGIQGGRMTESASSFVFDINEEMEFEYCFQPTQHALNGQYYFRIQFSGSATYNQSAIATLSVPDIIFYDGSDLTPDIYLGQTNQVIGYFEMISDAGGPELHSASVRLDGTRTGVSNLKLWASSDASFNAGSDTPLGSTISADPGNGNSVAFNSFTRAIGMTTTSFFLTADLAADATGSFQGFIADNTDLSVSGASLSTSISDAALSSRSVVLAGEPTVSTAAVTNVTLNSASGGGNVTADGGDPVTERGVCWSTTSGPTLDDAYTTDGSGTGSFTSSLTGLSAHTEYYVRAYASNAVRTNYGSEETFTTPLSVTFTDGSGYTPAITPGNTEQKIGRFILQGLEWGIYLESVTIKLNGLRSGYSNFKLTYSDEGGSGQLGTTVAIDPGHEQSVTFSGFSDEIDKWGQKTHYLRADVAAGANGAVQGVIVVNSSLSINNGMLGSTISSAVLSDVDISLPVELSLFYAESKQDGVVLRWTTESEVDNLGFILERAVGANHRSTGSEDVAGWQSIASYQTHPAFAGQGNTSSRTDYFYMDGTPVPGVCYIYRLSDVNSDGLVSILDVIKITLGEPGISDETRLQAASPNPFNPQTKISYQLADEASVLLSVYDIQGRLISRLFDGSRQSPGSYSVFWNGKDDFGRQSASGTYILRLIAGEVVQSQKVLLMR